jgi:hypothetical protein
VLGAGILVAAHWLYATRRALLATPRSIVRVEFGPGSACRIFRRNGSVLDGWVSESTIVSGSVVVLRVTTDRGRTAEWVAIVAGMIDAETLRTLRVHLRWDRDLAAPPSAPTY